MTIEPDKADSIEKLMTRLVEPTTPAGPQSAERTVNKPAASESRTEQELNRLRAELESLKQRPANPPAGTVNYSAGNPEFRQIHTGIQGLDKTLQIVQGMTFRDTLDTLSEARYLVIGILSLVLLGALIGVWLAEPEYRADALVQVDKTVRGVSVLAEASDFFTDEAVMAEEMEIAQSRLVLGQVVDSLKLDIVAKPRYLPLIGAAVARGYAEAGIGQEPWLKTLLSRFVNVNQYAWGGEHVKVAAFEVPEANLGQLFTLIAGDNGRYELVDAMGQVLAEGLVGKPLEIRLPGSESIKLVISEFKARPGTQFELIKKPRLQAINDLDIPFTVVEKGADARAGILQFKMRGSDPEQVKNIINEAVNIYVSQNQERRTTEAQQTLKFMEGQLPLLKAKLEKAEQALNSYRLQRGTADLNIETQLMLQKIGSIETTLSKLQQDREALLQQVVPQNAQVVALDKQIALLSKQLNSLNSKAKSLPDTQQQLLRLSRDVEVQTGLYTALLNKVQDLSIFAKGGPLGNVSVIDYAETPLEPESPRPFIDFGLALFLGIFLGVGLAFVRKTLRGGVEDPDLIEKRLGLPVYATIPHSPTQRKLLKAPGRKTRGQAVLALSDSEDLAIESLRSLRTLLHFAMVNATNNVIMLTSSAPGTGKSFVTANLSAILASLGKRVLVIDADLRKGRIHDYFGLRRKRGLSDFIADHLSVEQLINKTSLATLDVITTGTTPPNPSELLSNERFAFLVERMATQYDYVIVDAPPILAVTDPAIIGRAAGTALLVVKAGAHPLREIEEAAKRLKQAGVNLCGVVFNDVAALPSRYGYGKYGYAYAYKK